MSGFARLGRILLLAAGLLCAAQGPGHAQVAQVKIGLIGATTDAPIFIADAKGYFKQEGIEVSLVNFSTGGQMIGPLGTGELDVGAGAASVSLYNAAGRGVLIKVVADKSRHGAGFGHAALLVRKDLVDGGKFTGFKDLKSLKVAISGKGSGDESVLNEALKRGGLSWGEATVVYMGFPQHPAAFQNGAIDASLSSEPILTRILTAGTAVRFARNGEFYPDQQSAVIMYGLPFIEKRPDIARKFMRAYIMGSRTYNDAIADGQLKGPTSAEVISILVRYSLVKDAEVHKRSTPPAIAADGRLNVASLRKDWQFFKDTGQIDGKVTVDEVVDTKFVEEALASLPPYRPAVVPR